jgi:hypothetical protein
MQPPDPILLASGKDLAELAIKGWIGKEVIEKLLGPTAAYLGDQVKGLAEKCNINVGNIFKRAARIAGSRLDEPGAVNPRILRGVVNEGAFIEDEVGSEYFGGILASSRTPDGKDDRGVAFVALIRDLSSYQLKLHFLVYRCVRAFFRGEQLRVGVPTDRARMRVFIPLETFAAEIGVSEDDVPSVLDDAVHGLGRAGLIDPQFLYGKAEYLESAWPEATGPGLLLIPSVYGAQLFMWGHGLGYLPVVRFLDRSIEFPDSDARDIPKKVLGVPRREDVEALKSEVERAIRELEKHLGGMESRIADRKPLPVFPNDLREHIRYIVEQARAITDGVSAYFLEHNLETCLRPADDATAAQIFDHAKALKSTLSGFLKEDRPLVSGEVVDER